MVVVIMKILKYRLGTALLCLSFILIFQRNCCFHNASWCGGYIDGKSTLPLNILCTKCLLSVSVHRGAGSEKNTVLSSWSWNSVWRKQWTNNHVLHYSKGNSRR